MTKTSTPALSRRLLVVSTAVMPLLFAAGAGVWVSSFAGELPGRLAVHWGVDSRPDAFGSWEFSFGAAFVGAAVLCAMATMIGIWLGRDSVVRRLAVFLGMWSGIAIPWFVAGTLYVQRGTAGSEASPLVPLGISFGIATVIAVGAAIVVPGDPPMPTTEAVPAEAVRLPAADRESSWQHGVQMKHFGWLTGAGGAIAVILAVLAVWYGSGWLGFASGIVGVSTGAVLALGRWRLVVDRHGLTVRSAIGWPRVQIPLAEVVCAESTKVCLMDFGGWGYRVDIDGTVGIVVRSGEAIRVQQTGRRVTVVTVDDAETGAALLNTLADYGRV